MALVNVFSDLERVTFLKREPRVWKSALLRPFASFPVSARAVPVQGGAPYFFGVLLQTQRLAQFRPLGHAEIPLGSRRKSVGSPNKFLGSPKGPNRLAIRFRFTRSPIATMQ